MKIHDDDVHCDQSDDVYKHKCIVVILCHVLKEWSSHQLCYGQLYSGKAWYKQKAYVGIRTQFIVCKQYEYHTPSIRVWRPRFSSDCFTWWKNINRLACWYELHNDNVQRWVTLIRHVFCLNVSLYFTFE